MVGCAYNKTFQGEICFRTQKKNKIFHPKGYLIQKFSHKKIVHQLKKPQDDSQTICITNQTPIWSLIHKCNQFYSPIF